MAIEESHNAGNGEKREGIKQLLERIALDRIQGETLKRILEEKIVDQKKINSVLSALGEGMQGFFNDAYQNALHQIRNEHPIDSALSVSERTHQLKNRAHALETLRNQVTAMYFGGSENVLANCVRGMSKEQYDALINTPNKYAFLKKILVFHNKPRGNQMSSDEFERLKRAESPLVLAELGGGYVLYRLTTRAQLEIEGRHDDGSPRHCLVNPEYKYADRLERYVPELQNSEGQCFTIRKNNEHVWTLWYETALRTLKEIKGENNADLVHSEHPHKEALFRGLRHLIEGHIIEPNKCSDLQNMNKQAVPNTLISISGETTSFSGDLPKEYILAGSITIMSDCDASCITHALSLKNVDVTITPTALATELFSTIINAVEKGGQKRCCI